MAFRDYAVTETSALVARLLAESAARRTHDLHAIREGIRALAQSVEAALSTHTSTDPAAELQELTDRLTDAADASARTAADRARGEAQSRIDSLRSDAERHLLEKETLNAACEEATQQLDALRTAVDVERTRAESARADLSELQDKKRKGDIARSAADAAWKAERESIRAELEVAHGRLATLERTAAEQGRARQDLQSRLEAALASEQASRQRLIEAERQSTDARAAARAAAEAAANAAQAMDDAAERAQGLRVDQVQLLRDEVVAFATRTFTGLLGTIETLNGCGTVAEVLRILVAGVSAEFARVALFSVKGDRLEGIQQVGQDTASDISKVVMPLAINSLLTRAVATRQAALVRRDELEGQAIPFGGAPDAAMALPVVAHGEVLAVVYADDGARPQPPGDAVELRTKVAELLLRVATPSLERVLSDQMAVAELRDFTTFL